MNSIISNAQNFEDVILWRALGHVQPGFYVDIGAAWPDLHSVTKAFYDHGWRGINVEPSPALHSLLTAARPRDVNLQVAVAASVGLMNLDVVPDTGLSTLDPLLASGYREEGAAVETMEVEVTTLTQIVAQYVPTQAEIHFLKVDVEGFELEVLRGYEWTDHRPWVVVVEATRPGSQEDNFEHWEPLLIQNAYTFVYEDGVNRFYVAVEHDELRSAFRFPPNVFDGFQFRGEVAAEQRASSAEREGVTARETLKRSQFDFAKAQDHSEWLAGELNRATIHNRWLDEQLFAATDWGRQLSDRIETLQFTATERIEALQSAATERDLRLGLLSSFLDSEAHRFTTELQGWARERDVLLRERAVLQHHLAQVAEGNAALQRRIDALHHSTSWRASAPLRFVSGASRSAAEGVQRATRFGYRRALMPIVRPASVRAMSIVLPLTQPNGLTRSALRRIPGVGRRLANAAAVRGMLGPPVLAHLAGSDGQVSPIGVSPDSYETEQVIVELQRLCDQDA